MRQCTKCLIPKALDEFHKTKSGTAGRVSQCKTCVKLYHAHYYKLKGPVKRTNERRLYERKLCLDVRTDVLEHYSNGSPRCACCSEKVEDLLTIDHIHNDGSKHRSAIGGRNSGGYKTYAWLKRNKYPRGFQVLCFNCNCGKSKRGICPHQLQSK